MGYRARKFDCLFNKKIQFLFAILAGTAVLGLTTLPVETMRAQEGQGLPPVESISENQAARAPAWEIPEQSTGQGAASGSLPENYQPASSSAPYLVPEQSPESARQGQTPENPAASPEIIASSTEPVLSAEPYQKIKKDGATEIQSKVPEPAPDPDAAKIHKLKQNIKYKQFRADAAPSLSFPSLPDKRNFFARIIAWFTRSKRDIAATLIDPDKKERAGNISVDGENLIIGNTNHREFKPGLYTIKVKISEGKDIKEEIQQFEWGVLTANADQSIYALGDTANLYFGVLDRSGHTICDAQMTLAITDPQGIVSYPMVEPSGRCGRDNIVTVPDYKAAYPVLAPGKYDFSVIAATPEGAKELNGSFEVREFPEFEITRTGPTRINPAAEYAMQFSVVPAQNYTGTVVELVPASFEITGIENSSTTVEIRGDVKTITWQVDWQAGFTYEFGYRFDAPDISPRIFMLGPLAIGDFSETRQWQVASDAPGWLSGFSYRKLISLTGQAGAGTDYQVKLLIGETSGAAGENFDLGGGCTDFPNDIKFSADNGADELSYWVESTTSTIPNRLATVWVKVTANLDTNQDIYIYYGKSGQASSSNGPNTFIFFDDFELGNLSRWNTAQSSWSVQSTIKAEGTYAAKATNGASNRLLSKTISPGRSVLFHAKVRRESNTGEWTAPVFNPSTPSNANIYLLNMTYHGNFMYYIGGADYVNLPTPTSYAASTWYTVDAAIDNANQLFRWWIDGNDKGSATLKDGSGNLIGTTSYVNTARSFNDSNDIIFYLDQYWVRAFTATEPAYSAAGTYENNVAPVFTVDPHEDLVSDNTTPTNTGDNIVFKATATDGNDSYWYLAVCKTNEIATSTDAAPTCPGGEWAMSAATLSSNEATASSTVSASSTLESYEWYAFACDKTAASPMCSAMSNSGTSGNNGSPFAVNHAPEFNSIANNGPKDPGASLTVTGYFREIDASTTADIVNLHVCKSNDWTGSACGPAGEWCTATSSAEDVWNYRKRISITGQAGAGTDYQVKLLIGETAGAAGENFDLGGHALDFPNDIKFTDDNGTPLNYWLESTSGVAPNRLATVWVKVAANLDTDQDIYIQYGKSGQSSLSDGSNTFNHFTDFATTLPSGWSTPTNDSYVGYTFENGNLVLYGGVRGKGTYWWHGNSTTYGTATTLNGRIIETRYKAYQAGTLRTYQYGHIVGISAGDSSLGRYMLANRWLQLISNGSVRWSATPWNGSLTDYYISGLAFDGNYRRVFENYALQTSYDNGSAQADATFSLLGLQADTVGDGKHEGYFDWVRIRKFVASEPAYSSAGSEEASGMDSVSCDLTVPSPQAAGDFGYYPYLIDNHGLAAAGAAQGVLATSTINNIAPDFSVAPHEDPLSDGSSPISVGSNLTVKAIAGDNNNDQWYLAVCKTNEVTANSDSAPTCPGGAWAVSAAVDSGNEATATSTMTAGEIAESYEWYAFACDKISGAAGCSAMSNSGTGGNNGTPFSVNHAPLFASISNDGPKNPGQVLTITASLNDSDSENVIDTVNLHLCKSNDWTGSACGPAGEWCAAAVAGGGGGWPYRKQISLAGSTGAGTGYQARLLVGETSGASGENFDLSGHAANFPNDLKFTASDGVTELPYWVETVTGTTPNRLATVWVKVSANLDSNQDIYIFYGNASASSQSSGRNTFDLFDDWESGKDGSYWTFGGSVSPYWNLTAANKYAGTYSISNADISDSQAVYFKKSVTLAAASRLEFYWKVSSESDYDYLYYCINNDGCSAWSGYAGRISGTVDWAGVNYNLSAGANSIKFAYEKDSSVSIGSDAGWTDNIRVRKYVAVEPSYSSSSVEEFIAYQDLNCNFNAPAAAGNYDYYPYVVDNHALPAGGSVQGVGHTFSVNAAPAAPANLGAESYVDGSWGSDTTPILQFMQSDENATNTLAYRIQIDNESNFASPAVDYVSALMAQGAASFVVGQSAAGGSYAAGSEGQILADGVYYWRVMSTDNYSGASAWSAANSGNIAFGIDVAAPASVAVNSISSSAIQLEVNARAIDSGSGLHATPYWFNETTGNRGGSSSTAWQASNIFTDGGLAPNTLYSYQVKARDALNNESAFSSEVSKYTLADVPANISAVADLTSQITLSWQPSSNPSGTEYFAEIVAGANSGWTTGLNHSFSGLVCGTSYGLRVKSRNRENAETDWVSTNAVTLPCPSTGNIGGQYSWQDKTIPVSEAEIIIPATPSLSGINSITQAITRPIRQAIGKIKDIFASAGAGKEGVPPEEPVKEKAIGEGYQSQPGFVETLSDNFNDLINKFPNLGKIFQNLGVFDRQDFTEAGGTKIDLPGAGEITGVKNLDNAAVGQKQKLPLEFIFAQRCSNLDLSAKLQLTDNGNYEHMIYTVVRQPLRLVVKADGNPDSVTGRLIAKRLSQKNKIFSRIKTALTSLAGARSQSKELLMMEFAYADSDEDGIYQADIIAPGIDGDYEIETIIEYGGTAPSKQLKTILVVDPEGYIYTPSAMGEVRIKNATVSLYWLDPDTGKFYLWPASDYDQTNPQITDATGQYAFLVPPGKYYLEVSAEDFKPYKGQEFNVVQNSPVHENIKLESSKPNFLKVIWGFWGIIFLLIVGTAFLLLVLIKKSGARRGGFDRLN